MGCCTQALICCVFWHSCCFVQCSYTSIIFLISPYPFMPFFDDAWWARWSLLWGATPVGPLLLMTCCVPRGASLGLMAMSLIWSSLRAVPCWSFVVLDGPLVVAGPMVCCYIWGMLVAKVWLCPVFVADNCSCAGSTYYRSLVVQNPVASSMLKLIWISEMFV